VVEAIQFAVVTAIHDGISYTSHAEKSLWINKKLSCLENFLFFPKDSNCRRHGYRIAVVEAIQFAVVTAIHDGISYTSHAEKSLWINKKLSCLENFLFFPKDSNCRRHGYRIAVVEAIQFAVVTAIHDGISYTSPAEKSLWIILFVYICWSSHSWRA